MVNLQVADCQAANGPRHGISGKVDAMSLTAPDWTSFVVFDVSGHNGLTLHIIRRTAGFSLHCCLARLGRKCAIGGRKFSTSLTFGKAGVGEEVRSKCEMDG